MCLTKQGFVSKDTTKNITKQDLFHFACNFLTKKKIISSALTVNVHKIWEGHKNI